MIRGSLNAEPSCRCENVVDEGMQQVGLLQHLTSLDLSMVFNATGAPQVLLLALPFHLGCLCAWQQAFSFRVRFHPNPTLKSKP